MKEAVNIPTTAPYVPTELEFVMLRILGSMIGIDDESIEQVIEDEKVKLALN